MTQIEHRMSARELADWAAYYQVEPWGAWRDNVHAGLIAAEVARPYVRKGKKAPSYKDFLLRDAAAQDNDRAEKTAMALAALKAMAKQKRAAGLSAPRKRKRKPRTPTQ